MINELSIVIPTLNEENYLPKLLTSIANQSYKETLEVIVVDGKSKDNTTKVVNQFKNRIRNLHLVSTSQGVAHQRNVGADHAQFNILVFLDADMVLPVGFLSKIAAKIDSKERFVGLPLILPLIGSFIDYCYTFFSYTFKVLLSFSKPVITGKCIITTKTNHMEIKGFNEKVIFAEDIDYGLRSIAQGAKYHLYFSPHLYTSTRRRKEMGILRLNVIQFRGYLDNIRNGAITDRSKYDYKFGKHE